MSLTLPQVLAVLDRSRPVMAAAVRETAGAPSQRATRLVTDLASLWPAPFYACLLRQNGQEAWSARREDGSAPAAEDKLHCGLRSYLEQPDPAPTSRADLGAPVAVAPIRCGGRPHGALACGLPDGQREAAAVFLSLAAERLAGLLAREEAEREEPAERERLAWLGNVSELTAIVAHEFNNLLNGILLHVAVLKQELPKEWQSELEVIRGLGNNAASLVKQLQKYNSKRRGSLQTVDLNQAVREVVGERLARDPDVPLKAELDPDLPAAQAKPPELARLLRILIDQALAATGAGAGPVMVRTLRAGNRPQLRVEDSGPPIDEALLPKLFEPFAVVRPGGDEAGLAVCHTLARHMHGSLRAENRPGQGVAFTIDFTPAAK